jgi:hypothetical protein
MTKPKGTNSFLQHWFKDSTIEFNSIHPPIKYLWYKDDNKWRNSVKNLERDDFFSNPPWKEDEYINDDYETYDNYSDDYDDPNW